MNYSFSGKPSGYDRVRNMEIGNKDFELETLEEAYTTEHWLVRIYKVKDLKNRGYQISHNKFYFFYSSNYFKLKVTVIMIIFFTQFSHLKDILIFLKILLLIIKSISNEIPIIYITFFIIFYYHGSEDRNVFRATKEIRK